MNWTTFLMSVTLVYLTYYGLNLIYDYLLVRKHPKADATGDVLFFEENVKPQIILPDAEPQAQEFEADADGVMIKELPSVREVTNALPQESSKAVQYLGAVGMKELFNRAKQNLFEYTGTISY